MDNIRSLFTEVASNATVAAQIKYDELMHTEVRMAYFDKFFLGITEILGSPRDGIPNATFEFELSHGQPPLGDKYVNEIEVWFKSEPQGRRIFALGLKAWFTRGAGAEVRTADEKMIYQPLVLDGNLVNIPRDQLKLSMAIEDRLLDYIVAKLGPGLDARKAAVAALLP